MGAAQASDISFSAFSRERMIGATRNHRLKRSKNCAVTVKKTTKNRPTFVTVPRAAGDAIIQPHETREVLSRLLQYVSRPMPKARFHTGVCRRNGRTAHRASAQPGYSPPLFNLSS
jgi:acetyl-CoA carboxylase carboxyltransferase component